MIELIQDIQKEIEYVIDGMGRNHPLRDNLIITNTKINSLINTLIDEE